MLFEIRRTDDLNTKMSAETDMVIDTLLSPGSSLPIEKPQLSPRGHLCLCYSCPCLPSSTSGSFH